MRHELSKFDIRPVVPRRGGCDDEHAINHPLRIEHRSGIDDGLRLHHAHLVRQKDIRLADNLFHRALLVRFWWKWTRGKI